MLQSTYDALMKPLVLIAIGITLMMFYWVRQQVLSARLERRELLRNMKARSKK